jgi:predicted nucleotidyltransferase
MNVFRPSNFRECQAPFPHNLDVDHCLYCYDDGVVDVFLAVSGPGVEQMSAVREFTRGTPQRKHQPDLRPNERAGLTAFVERLRQRYGDDLLRVVLFGSKARGDFDDESDLDLLIVVRMLDGRYRQYWSEIADIAWQVVLEYGVVTSLIVKDQADYARMRRHRLLLARNIERDGIELSRLPPPARASTAMGLISARTGFCVTPGTGRSVSSSAAICWPSLAEASNASRLAGSGMRGQSPRMPSAFSCRYAGA